MSLLVLLGRGIPIRLKYVGRLAGRWAGFRHLPGHRDDDEYVELALNGDGIYESASVSAIEFMDARGRAEVSHGRLVIEGSAGARGFATLYSVDNQPTLLIEMAVGGTACVRLKSWRAHPLPGQAADSRPQQMAPRWCNLCWPVVEHEL